MAKFHVYTRSIYGIKQFSVCCHGIKFATAAKRITSSLSLTVSINPIVASELEWYLNYLEICYQNAAIIPRTSFTNNKSTNSNKGRCNIRLVYSHSWYIHRYTPSTCLLCCDDIKDSFMAMITDKQQIIS